MVSQLNSCRMPVNRRCYRLKYALSPGRKPGKFPSHESDWVVTALTSLDDHSGLTISARTGRPRARIPPERRLKFMARKITYWVTTVLLAAMSLLAGRAYLSGGPQMAQVFTHLGYPQQLRIILGIAKPLGAIALLVPGMALLKEWAYAGFAFAWIAA